VLAEGTHRPLGAHALDWHMVDAFCCVQPASPLRSPHLLSAEQMLSAQSEADAQATVTAPPHVTVVALHRPDWQTAEAFVQLPVCSPSVGIAVPFVNLAVQSNVERLQ
jgi:hypothetical protein